MDKLSRLIFKDLDMHLSAELWPDFDNPLHGSLLGATTECVSAINVSNIIQGGIVFCGVAIRFIVVLW
jgi:hypothetical protein